MSDTWNSFNTASPQGMTASATKYAGHNGDQVTAYVARPSGGGPHPGIVVIHHMPGWDEFYQETTRRLANHGYICISPDLYSRVGTGTPDDVAAKVRADGGVPDEQVVGDLSAASKWLKSQSDCNGKIGVIGTCSGGRYSFLLGCRAPGDFNAVVDLWGGGVVQPQEQLNPKQPVAPVDYTKDLQAPLLGLFGNDDQRPSPADVDRHEEELKKHGKNYEFHRYDGAGHGFFYYDRPAYRQQQAMDGWNKVFAFFEQNLR
jgi:carboxymethylenebutenolidase